MHTMHTQIHTHLNILEKWHKPKETVHSAGTQLWINIGWLCQHFKFGSAFDIGEGHLNAYKDGMYR